MPPGGCLDGESAVSVALKHLSEAPPAISQLRPDVHPALESVVMAALAKDPAHRWQSADDFAAGLAAAGEQIAAGPVVGQETAAFAPIPMPVPVHDGEDAAPGPIAPVAEPQRKGSASGAAVVHDGPAPLALPDSCLPCRERAPATPKPRGPPGHGDAVIEAREILERAGFEVEETRVQSERRSTASRPGPDTGVEADEGPRSSLV